MEDVRPDLDPDVESLLVAQLVQICKVAMTNDLVLVVAKAEEYDRFATFEARIIDLHLKEAGAKLEHLRSPQTLKGADLISGLTTLHQPHTNLV